MIHSSRAALSLVLLFAAPPHSKSSYTEILQPARYASNSGEFVLDVDPSNPNGTGPARYVLSHRDEVVWSAELPFSFWRAAVSNRGAVAGYAYSGRPDSDGDGTFRAVVLSPSGSHARDEVVPRRWSGGAPACPWARGVFVQDDLDRFVFRMRDPAETGEDEAWWTYDGASGEECSKARPLERFSLGSTHAFSVEAIGVPGTPLTLARWHRGDTYACFTLLDQDWEPVWRLDLPRDFSAPGDAGIRMRWEIGRKGVILGASQPGRFELRLVARGERVTFEAEPDASSPGAWSVREVAAAPFQEPLPAWPDVPTIELAHRGSVQLTSVGESHPGPIRDIEEYALLADGTIEFIRREADRCSFSLIHIDSEGRLIREQAIDRIERDEGGLVWGRLTSGPWIAAPWNGRTRAWTIDGRTGRVESLAEFRCSDVEGIVATPNGGFLVVGGYSVRLLDSRGKRLRTLGGTKGEPSELSSPKDVAITSDGRIVVMEQFRHTLQIFDLSGEHLGTQDLEAAFGGEPNYLTGIEADLDGGVLIHEFDGEPPIWRLDREGRTRSSFATSDSGGITAGNLERNLRVAPDGRLWSTDGRVFVQLDASGVVERCVGAGAEEDVLHEPGAALVDPLGRIVVQDERTANVFVFDAGGRRTLVGRARPEQIESASSTGRLGIDARGSVFVEQDYLDSRYLMFDAQGENHGYRELVGERVSFRPGIERYWGFRDHQLLGFDADSAIVAVIDRRPDRRFFHEVKDFAVAAGGKFAVSDESGLALFDAGGEPLASVSLPRWHLMRNLAYSGRWAALSSWAPELLLVDTATSKPYRFTHELRTIPDSSWHVGFSPDGRELWLLETDAMVLHCFALPD